jgi:hypothetical protein
MTWIATWAVKCDGRCGAVGPVAGSTREAEALAERDGWEIGCWRGYLSMTAHLCPACKGRDVPEFTRKGATDGG